ncbi:hypothetical protein D3C71_1345290 [compost metagenome]
MDTVYSERKIIRVIKDTLIRGSLGDATQLLRYTEDGRNRVIYRIPSRNKAVSIYLSSPVKDYMSVNSNLDQMITAYKVYNLGQFHKALLLPYIQLSLLSYKEDIEQMLYRELSSARGLTYSMLDDWMPFDYLKDQVKYIIINCATNGHPIYTGRQLDDARIMDIENHPVNPAQEVFVRKRRNT